MNKIERLNHISMIMRTNCPEGEVRSAIEDLAEILKEMLLSELPQEPQPIIVMSEYKLADEDEVRSQELIMNQPKQLV